jgi:uncharacterized protein (UPF0147 family)
MSVTKVKIDTEKYITPGEVEKLQYPKPPKSNKSDYISEPEMKSDLQYPTKKMAIEEFRFKLEDVMDPGTKEKLIFDKKVSFPDEGDVKVITDTKLPKKYMPEGERGGIQKAKEFKVDELQPAEKIDISKYYLEFEKAKPFQKQFSLGNKMLPQQIVDKDESEEYARTVTDILPREVPKKPTKNRGKRPSKTRPIKKKSNIPEVTLPDVIGYTVLSLIKFAKEEPDQFEKLVSAVETSQFLTPEEITIRKEAMLQKMAGRTLEEWLDYLKKKKVPRKIRRQFKHIWESALERGESEEYAARAAIDILPKRVLEKPTKYHGKGPGKTGPISKKSGLDEDIQEKQKQIAELQEKIADLQKELAELQAKKAEEVAKTTK